MAGEEPDKLSVLTGALGYKYVCIIVRKKSSDRKSKKPALAFRREPVLMWFRVE